MKHVLVCGWYDHGNLGDDGFALAFRDLWGDRAEFSFVSEVPTDVNDYDALIIGGGSIVDQRIPARIEPQKVLVPIAAVGIGIHIQIDQQAMRWLRRARIVVARNQPPPTMPEAIVAPDLFFSRKWDIPPLDLSQSGIVVLANEHAIPTATGPVWAVRAWDWFATEFARILDVRPKDESITFFPMCSSGKISVMGPHDDRLAAARIVSLMRTRERVEFVNDPAELDSLVTLIASSSLVISLRFHGAMLAALLGVPFVGISMHDKMRSFFVENELQNWCDFYGFSGEQLLTAINASPSAERMKELREEGYERWQHMSDIVAGELSL